MSRADGARVRVHVPGGAIVVPLRVVRVRGDVGLHVGAAAGGVALHSMAVWVSALSLRAVGSEEQCARQNN